MQVAPGSMEQDAQIVMRVPQVMADQLKEYAARLSREVGVPVSLAAAARKLLAEGLDRAGVSVTESDASTDSDEENAPRKPPITKVPAKRKMPRRR